MTTQDPDRVHPAPSDLEIDNDTPKASIANVEVIANADKPNPRKEAPAYVAALDPDERQRAEARLVRKIDFRLLPVLVVMYILNYLDRNNIVCIPSLSCFVLVDVMVGLMAQAAARLAGLETDLNLHGNQYQVRFLSPGFQWTVLME